MSFSASAAPLLSPGAMDDVTDILLASTKRYEDLPDAERKVGLTSHLYYTLLSRSLDDFGF